MNIQLPIQELHEAAREEWLATRAAVRCRRHAILGETRARLSVGQDPDRDVLPALYRELASERIVDASIAFIVTHQEEMMMLGFVEGFPMEVIRRCLKLDFGQTICGAVARSRVPMHVTDIQRSAEPATELARNAGITAFACEPLVVGDRLFGTLSFATRTRRWFDQEDLDFFHAVADCVASARARTETSFERRVSRRAMAGCA